MEKSYVVSKKQHNSIAKLLTEITQKFDLGKECSDNPVQVILALNNINKSEFNNRCDSDLVNLIKLSPDVPVIIPACLGAQFNSDAEKLLGHNPQILKNFLTYCDPDELLSETPEIEANVYLVDDDMSTCRQMLRSLKIPFTKLALTKHQIINFFLNYQGWTKKTHDGDEFIFLTKSKNSFHFHIFKNSYYLYLKTKKIDYLVTYSKRNPEHFLIDIRQRQFIIVPKI